MLLINWMEEKYFWSKQEYKIKTYVWDHSRIKLSISDQTGVYFLLVNYRHTIMDNKIMALSCVTLHIKCQISWRTRPLCRPSSAGNWRFQSWRQAFRLFAPAVRRAADNSSAGLPHAGRMFVQNQLPHSGLWPVLYVLRFDVRGKSDDSLKPMANRRLQRREFAEELLQEHSEIRPGVRLASCRFENGGFVRSIGQRTLCYRLAGRQRLPHEPPVFLGRIHAFRFRRSADRIWTARQRRRNSV